MSQEIIIQKQNTPIQFQKICELIREDIRDNPYIEETLKVLTVGGYRSAIGSFWNAVVDDLRNKILFRSISMFNKEMKPNKAIKSYEDFQDNINDEMLIDGAYKIGVIGWEAHKVLKQAKETRHIFDGHPKSSDPAKHGSSFHEEPHLLLAGSRGSVRRADRPVLLPVHIVLLIVFHMYQNFEAG